MILPGFRMTAGCILLLLVSFFWQISWLTHSISLKTESRVLRNSNDEVGPLGKWAGGVLGMSLVHGAYILTLLPEGGSRDTGER